jgi:hypothetical protein
MPTPCTVSAQASTFAAPLNSHVPAWPSSHETVERLRAAGFVGRMPFGGTLSNLDWHSHNLKFQHGFLAAAAPAALGLDAPNLSSLQPHTPIRTVEAGFANNSVLYEHMLNKLEAAPQAR